MIQYKAPILLHMSYTTSPFGKMVGLDFPVVARFESDALGLLRVKINLHQKINCIFLHQESVHKKFPGVFRLKILDCTLRLQMPHEKIQCDVLQKEFLAVNQRVC